MPGKEIGQKQVDAFKRQCKKRKGCQDSIKEKLLPLFKAPEAKKGTSGKIVASLKSNVAL